MNIHQILSETSVTQLIERLCTKDFTFQVDDLSVTIEKDMFFFVPVYAFHHNPNYFADPDKFDPDRFSKDCKISDVYAPFGIGKKY